MDDGEWRRAARPPGAKALLVAAAVFALVTLDVLADGALTRLDLDLSDLMVRWDLRGSLWTKAPIYALTQIGGRVTVFILVLPILAYLCWTRRTLRPLYRLVVLGVLLTGTVYLLKYGIERPAPRARFLNVTTGESYPSGHVPNAVLMWGLAAWCAAEYRLPVRVRHGLAVWRWVAPALVAAGMLLLDYHWLTDLIGGYALGVLLLWGVFGVDRVALGHLPGAKGGEGGAARRGGTRPVGSGRSGSGG